MILVFRNSLKSQESFATQSPEQMQAEMALWQAWMGKIAEKNQLVEKSFIIVRV